MAASRESVNSMEYGSEPFHDFSCTLCDNEGKSVEASRYCQACRVYMCVRCIQNHNKFPLNVQHKLLDETQFMTEKQQTKCVKHPGADIKMFCENHDAVCCTVCKVLEHSGCGRLQEIPEAKECSTSKMENFIIDVGNLITDRKADLSRVERGVHSVTQTIAEFCTKISMHFDGLEKKSLNELDIKKSTIMNRIRLDLTYLQNTREEAQDILMQLKSFDGGNGNEFCFRVKESKRVIHNSKVKIQEISESLNKEYIHFETNSDIENYLENIDTIGSYSDMNIPVCSGKQTTAFQYNEVAQKTMMNSKTDISFLDTEVTGHLFSQGTYLAAFKTDVNAEISKPATTIKTSVNLPKSPKEILDNQVTSTAEVSLNTSIGKGSHCTLPLPSPSDIPRFTVESSETSISREVSSTQVLDTHINTPRLPLPCPDINQTAPHVSECNEIPCARAGNSFSGPISPGSSSTSLNSYDYLPCPSVALSDTGSTVPIQSKAISGNLATVTEHSTPPPGTTSSNSGAVSKIYENLPTSKSSDSKHSVSATKINTSDTSVCQHIYDSLPSHLDKDATESSLSACMTPSSLNTSSNKQRKCIETSHESHFIQYQPLKMMRFNVKERSDQHQCNIFDLCELSDGKILLIDDGNEKLKLCDQSHKLVDSIRLSGDPYSVCAAGPCQVAVALRSKMKIQFIQVGKKLSFAKSFRVNNYCRGMAYVSGNLNVCIGDINSGRSGQIEVYNNNGKLQNCIPKAPQRLPSAVKYIVLSETVKRRFVTMYSCDSVAVLDNEGNVTGTYSSDHLQQPEGICTDGKGQVFVCGYHSNTVVQLSPEDKRIELILNEANGIKKPIAIHFDGVKKQLFVSCSDSNEVLICTMK